MENDSVDELIATGTAIHKQLALCTTCCYAHKAQCLWADASIESVATTIGTSCGYVPSLESGGE